ncbi:uncharacterized protein begain isoform X2 [Vanacampus margaritifer]
MVHLCVSISDDGVRLESIKKRSPEPARRRTNKTTMTTLERQPRSRKASTRQDRGSCSSTASCPIFSGPYSDQEEDPPLRRQSSPLIKASLSSLHKATKPTKRHSSGIQGSTTSLQGSLPSLQGSLPNFSFSLPRLKGSLSRMRRRSLSSLDNSSPGPSERSASPGLHSGIGSSSDDDGSWDTNSWSSGATCLLRTSSKQDGAEKSGGILCNAEQATTSAEAEPEIIYQNLIFTCPASKTEVKVDLEKTNTVQKNDAGTPSANSPCPNKEASAVSTPHEEKKKEDRRKFSQFLNEVTGRVLKSNHGPSQQQSTLRHRHPSPTTAPPTQSQPPLGLLHSTPTNLPAPTSSWCSLTSSNLQTINENDSKDITSSIHQWSKTLPSCKVLEPADMLRKIKVESPSYRERGMELCTKIQSQASTGRLYLETDIDRVRQLDELMANGTLIKDRNEKHPEKVLERGREREDRSPWEKNGVLAAEKRKETDQGSEPLWEKEKDGKEKETKVIRNSYEPKSASGGRSDPCPVFKWPEGFPRMSYRSISLPRAVNITDCDGETQRDMSSFHDHKEDLRKRLSYTAHKLEMVESEFDSTRQYLETELRRAQEELEKFTEKLRRIQSSYAALQRINQDLEDKMHRTDLYRKDCNLAAQLLQCSKSHYRAHKMSELPMDFQERISSHIEKHNQGSEATLAMCHSNYSDAVPTAIIAKILEKPEPGNSGLVTRSPSPHPQDGQSLAEPGSNDHLNRRVAYKTSDLYCSDTALYCPERWQETDRRQSIDLHGTGTSLRQLQAQNSTDSNPDEEAYHSGSFSHHELPSSFHHHEEFSAGSLPASSSYSSFSLASDDKGGVAGGGVHTASSTLSTSHQGLYMDWRDGGSGEYERKSISSYDKDGSGFPKSNSIQHIVTSRSPQKGTSPAYTRTASCFSEPYHSSTPRLASSHSMGSTTGLGQAQGTTLESRADIHVQEDELSSRWKQLSVEDINTFSSSYRNVTGRGSPYSFSECHYAMGPSSKTKGSLYSSFQEGDDVFHSHMLDQCFALASPSPGRSPKHPPAELRKHKKNSATYRAKDGNPDSSLLSGSSKEKERSKKDYVNLSAGSSAESLHQSPLEASSLQHYPSPRPSVRPRPSSSSALSAVGPALPKKTSPRYQKFGSTGLTRKDSLTKAQLYGTLLN